MSVPVPKVPKRVLLVQSPECTQDHSINGRIAACKVCNPCECGQRVKNQCVQCYVKYSVKYAEAKVTGDFTDLWVCVHERRRIDCRECFVDAMGMGLPIQGFIYCPCFKLKRECTDCPKPTERKLRSPRGSSVLAKKAEVGDPLPAGLVEGLLPEEADVASSYETSFPVSSELIRMVEGGPSGSTGDSETRALGKQKSPNCPAKHRSGTAVYSCKFCNPCACGKDSKIWCAPCYTKSPKYAKAKETGDYSLSSVCQHGEFHTYCRVCWSEKRAAGLPLDRYRYCAAHGKDKYKCTRCKPARESGKRARDDISASPPN